MQQNKYEKEKPMTTITCLHKHGELIRKSPNPTRKFLYDNK